MKLLLDSHIVYWSIYEPERLPPIAAAAIAESSNNLFVSHASLWELSNKAGIGKLPIAGTSVQTMLDRILALGAAELPITKLNIAAAASLPPHHLDPFDRMLIAQAQANHLTLVTVDPNIHKYDVQVLLR